MGTMFGMGPLRAFVFAVAVLAILAGCTTARMYVDPTLPMYSESDLPHPAQPHPVRLVFEFRSNGVANPGLTATLRPRIVAVVKQSGLFSTISDSTPAGDGGQLKLVIDNLAETGGARKKSLESGLTLGVAGSMVTDDYVCTASYAAHDKVIQASVRHALRTAVGNERGPAGEEPKEPVVAIRWVIDQIAWNALKNLADQNAFE